MKTIASSVDKIKIYPLQKEYGINLSCHGSAQQKSGLWYKLWTVKIENCFFQPLILTVQIDILKKKKKIVWTTEMKK